MLMKEQKEDFESETKIAIDRLLEIEDDLEQIDPDDVKHDCEKIRKFLCRLLKAIQDNKIVFKQ